MEEDKKITDFIKPTVEFTKSGKQDIAGTPFEIDKTTLNALLEMGIPLNDAFNIFADIYYGKNRDKYFYDDQEIFVDEDRGRSRDVGIKYNFDDDDEGIGFLLKKNIDTGDDEAILRFLKRIKDFLYNKNKLTEEELKEKLINLDTEYECSIASGVQRTPDEIYSDMKSVIKKLKWHEDDAHDYIDWVKNRY